MEVDVCYFSVLVPFPCSLETQLDLLAKGISIQLSQSNQSSGSFQMGRDICFSQRQGVVRAQAMIDGQSDMKQMEPA